MDRSLLKTQHRSRSVGTSEHDQRTAFVSRFGDWASIEDFVEIPNFSQSRSHYSGVTVEQRMNAIRHAIRHIRTHWHDYPLFVQGLRSYLDQNRTGNTQTEAVEAIEAILSNEKEWADRKNSNVPQVDNFDVIRLYTSNFGYAQIFAMLNSAFRTDSLTDLHNNNDLRSAVFLVELLNIDLFNYLSARPIPGFQGMVYRGVSFTARQIHQFEQLAHGPVEDRHWAIPLSMMSASTNPNVALEFAGLNAAQAPLRRPFLWRIHISDLDSSLLQIYHSLFPQTVVSTICAVSIQDLSPFQESEVLLRGPFFQLIRIHEEFVGGSTNAIIPVMDLVMLNVNRDHPSTMELGEDEDRARKVFSCLVGIGRATASVKVASVYGLMEDVKQFEEQVEMQKKKLLDLGCLL